MRHFGSNHMPQPPLKTGPPQPPQRSLLSDPTPNSVFPIYFWGHRSVWINCFLVASIATRKHLLQPQSGRARNHGHDSLLGYMVTETSVVTCYLWLPRSQGGYTTLAWLPEWDVGYKSSLEIKAWGYSYGPYTWLELKRMPWLSFMRQGANMWLAYG